MAYISECWAWGVHCFKQENIIGLLLVLQRKCSSPLCVFLLYDRKGYVRPQEASTLHLGSSNLCTLKQYGRLKLKFGAASNRLQDVLCNAYYYSSTLAFKRKIIIASSLKSQNTVKLWVLNAVWPRLVGADNTITATTSQCFPLGLLHEYACSDASCICEYCASTVKQSA